MRTRPQAARILGVIGLAAGSAAATPVVTFYNNRAAFLAATTPSAVLNFECITTDTGIHDFGPAYHTGAVTFTTSDSNNHIFVVGRNAPSMGTPFDSAQLIPEGEPTPLHATFDAGSNITAVGGLFSILADAPEPGIFILMGSTGQLDRRTVSLGSSMVNHTHTFYGFTVTGDTISSLTLDFVPGAQGFDDFTYGTVPAPASAVLMLLGGMAVTRRRR